MPLIARVRTVATPQGDARVHRHQASLPRATLLLGHGASGGVDAPDLQRLAQRLPRRGITVVLVEQPWRVAGQRVAVRPPLLDAAFVAVCDRRTRTPLVVGGRSAGARVACRTARTVGAVGVLALAFPLHPPGRPDRSRADELLQVGLPTLVVQGDRDPFGSPGELSPLRSPARRLLLVPGADHGFSVPTRAEAEPGRRARRVLEATLEWVVEVAEPAKQIWGTLRGGWARARQRLQPRLPGGVTVTLRGCPGRSAGPMGGARRYAGRQ